MSFDRDDLEALYVIVRRHLHGPAPDLAAYRIAHRIEGLLATSSNGSAESGARDTDWEQRWATTEEAARALDVTERWARELAASGSIGAMKRGGRWWIPRDALPE